MGTSKASGRKLTKEQRDKVLELSLQGISPGEVARQLGVDALRVSGTVRSLVNAGLLPPQPGASAGKGIRMDAGGNSTPAAAAETPAAAPVSGGRWTASPTSGFIHPTQAVKYLLTRHAPQNDGLVGSFTSEPSDDEVGKQYGHGVYRIEKQIPGKLPEFREVNVSQAFGPPRWPRQGAPTPGAERPPLRPWQRFGQPRGDEDEADQPMHARAPFMPSYRPRPPQYDDGGRDRAFSEFGRHAVSGAESVAVAVVDKLSSLQERTLERMEAQSKRGPDTFVQTFYKEQQDWQRRVSEEDRQKADSKQEAERNLEGDRRREDEERHRRWQDDQDKRHSRDMERIKEERQTLLDLEAKKIELIREESKAREEILRKEIESYSKRVEEVQGQSESRIEEMQDSLKENLKQGRNTLEKEHDIRKTALDNEHMLRGEMIKLQEQMVKIQSSDNLSGMLGQLVEGVKETIAKVVELKKFEMASPEDRAAAIGQQGAPGNVQEIPPGAQTQAPPPGAQVPPQAAAAAAATANPAAAGGGNGHAATIAAEQAIQEGLNQPVAQYIIREWGLSLQGGASPALFVNTFMEWMKDETPSGADGRKATTAFAQIMANRDWPSMKSLLSPAIPEDMKTAFDGERAPGFYNAARVMIVGSVTDYWDGYLAEKNRVMQERQAAQQPAAEAPPAPAPAAPAAPVAAPAAPAAAAPAASVAAPAASVPAAATAVAEPEPAAPAPSAEEEELEPVPEEE